MRTLKIALPILALLVLPGCVAIPAGPDYYGAAPAITRLHPRITHLRSITGRLSGLAYMAAGVATATTVAAVE